MKYKNKINITLAISILALLLCGGAYAYLYYSFINVEKEVTALYSENTANRATLAELQRVEHNLKSTLGNKDRLTALFVSEDSVVDFIELLESMMKEYGIDGAVDSVAESPKVGEEVGSKATLNVTLNLSGGWNSLLKFTALMEVLPYRSTIDTLRFSYITASNADGNAKPGYKPGWNERVTLHVLMVKSVGSEQADQTGGPSNMTNDEEI